jgi:hypothetical protein
VYADDTPYLVNTKCTHLTIAGTEVAGYKLSTNARMPKTVQELILNVPVGFDEKLFLWSDDL